jgi:acyl-CoA dehydrogenase
MAWDFEADAEYQAQLDWADAFVRDEIEPLDLVLRDQQYVPPDARVRRIIDPLKDEVRKRRLWATHLGPELGGEGHGQPGTPRSSPTSARRSRRSATCGRCSTARSSRVTR